MARKTRGSRALVRSSATSGAATPTSPKARGGPTGEDYRPPPAHPAPYDAELEEELVGALAANNHVGPAPAPADFYTPRLALLARAFVEHRDLLGRIDLIWLDRTNEDGSVELVFAYDIVGLPELLTDLGAHQPRRDALLAGILAAVSHLTDEGHTRRLRALADTRRRLIALEEERAELLGTP